MLLFYLEDESPLKKEKQKWAKEIWKQFNALSYNTGRHCMMSKRCKRLPSKHVHTNIVLLCKCDKYTSHIEESRNLSPRLPLMSYYLLVRLHGEYFIFILLDCIPTLEDRSLVLQSVISSKFPNEEVIWYEWGHDQK